MNTEKIYIRFKEHLSDKQIARAVEHLKTVANVSNVRRSNRRNNHMSMLWYYADVPVDKVEQVLSVLPNRKTIFSARRLLDTFDATVVASEENVEDVCTSTIQQLKSLSGVFNAWERHYLNDEVTIAVHVLQSADTRALRKKVKAIPGMKPIDWKPGGLVAL